MTALQIECVRGIPSAQNCVFCGIECVNGLCPTCDDGLQSAGPYTSELWGERIECRSYYETDGRYWGYAAGNDLFDCLWYEVIAACRNAACRNAA